MSKKKIVFLTGTRADFGKLKSLIKITQKSHNYEVHLFVTGMHMNSKYGATVQEIVKSGFENIYSFINHDTVEHMDRTLAKTIDGFSHYIAEIKPDLIVVHGDRVEALAGAIVGSLNNILVTHIEGGEISGTIDELIRHAVSKMSHVHLVANEEAKKRLLQLGEIEESIQVIGSPDLDLMNPAHLPPEVEALEYYGIKFNKYAIAMFHPVTTEYEYISLYAKNFVDALIESQLNYIVIYPNNDLGSNEILAEYTRLKLNEKFRIYPSLRFEYFLTLLQNAEFIIGNSSAGIREAPYYNVPTIDIGTRQLNRAHLKTIIHCNYDKNEICKSIEKVTNSFTQSNDVVQNYFGDGKSDKMFLELLDSDNLWKINHQKQFRELV
ncbi:UDP-N-acetylglucosamine 2-epimerase [Sulfurospirillum barnesii]|uniref:UDP-N-acetyl-D-glucosamine 2-epimerase, UDP-hydrolysing n=1 Tax=Sulfurospirillum barnesii (strain ATCC 700032 / DSM 10660 / SES-3) TaxID=760154 RepID=I3XZ01_SULBS|nr:UDP-N-acetylglucosamine 2-epimerase [Sulfurospirillum barnesii]AFL69175.1 UDP-N-acetyl-D-glucosamine 2-epimerase, UDP-hydrolysing [Sulfurospirillum barnesii SES-3]